MHLHDPIPSLEGASEWIGGGPVEVETLRGRPVLLHLWSQGCEGCKGQLPSVRRWVEEFGPQGLQVIGLHARSAPDQRDEEAIAIAGAAGLTHPIAFDPRGAPITRRLGARFVPSYYLFDGDGLLRHKQAGYRADEMTEAAIRRVLAAEQEAGAGTPG